MADIGQILEGINTGLTQGLDAYNAARERKIKEKHYDLQTQQIQQQSRHQMATEDIGLLNAGYAKDPATGKYVPTPEKAAEREGRLNAQKQTNELHAAQIGKLKAETDQVYEGKKPSEAQSQSALYAKRLEQAENVFRGLQEKGYDRTASSQGLLSYAPEALKPSDLKQQEQAERNFVNAILRKESGAAIAQSEFANAEKQYFPRANDSPEVLEQKRQNRELAMQGLKVSSGKAYEKLGAETALAQQSRQAPQMSHASVPMAAEQSQAMSWAQKNPRDPRAIKIMQMLGK
jgi:hypothetical protein